MKSFCDVLPRSLDPHAHATGLAFLRQRLAKFWANANQQFFIVNNGAEQIALENVLLCGIFDMKLDLG
jgi:hypothetical protein